MRFRVSPTLRIAAGLLLAVLLGVVGYHVLQWRIPGSSEALLEQADEKSWVNNWIAAEPIYRQAELVFIRNHEPSKALLEEVVRRAVLLNDDYDMAEINNLGVSRKWPQSTGAS